MASTLVSMVNLVKCSSNIIFQCHSSYTFRNVSHLYSAIRNFRNCYGMGSISSLMHLFVCSIPVYETEIISFLIWEIDFTLLLCIIMEFSSHLHLPFVHLIVLITPLNHNSSILCKFAVTEFEFLVGWRFVMGFYTSICDLVIQRTLKNILLSVGNVSS